MTFNESALKLDDAESSVEINVKEIEVGKEDQVHFFSNWIWRAVERLVDSPDFQSSPKWIASRLNISVDKAIDALDGLERLRFIKRDGANYVRFKPDFDVGSNSTELDILLHIHSRIAPQVISKINNKSEFTTFFMLGDNQLIKKYMKMIYALVKEMEREGIERKLTEVIALELCFAGMTEDLKGDKK